MKLTISNEGRYNFHMVPDLTIIVRENRKIYRDHKVVAVSLSPSQMRRIEKHFCGRIDCGCGSMPRGLEYTYAGGAIIHLDEI